MKTDLFQSQFIPAKINSPRLMIVLHGKGDSLDPFSEFDRELRLYDMNYLLLNAPQRFMGGFSWYKEPPKMMDEVSVVREKMLQLMESLFQEGWKPENIFLFGFSQGCLISADLALNLPYQLGGVIGISGYFHFFPRWRKKLNVSMVQTPWLMTHGFRDDILPIGTTKFGVRKLRDAGYSVDLIEMNKGHVLKENEYPLIRKWIQKQVKYLRDESQRVRESSTTDLLLPPASAFDHRIEKLPLQEGLDRSESADQ